MNDDEDAEAALWKELDAEVAPSRPPSPPADEDRKLVPPSGIDGSDGSDGSDTSDTSDATDATDGSDGSRFSRRPVVGVFVSLFVVIGGLGVLAYVLFEGSNDASTAPGADRSLGDATVADDFSRPEDTEALGRANTGQLWEEDSGTWGVTDGQAHVTTPNANELGRSWAVINMGSGNGSVAAEAATMANGWGIVFRYRGPFNYWMLQASTEYASYSLIKVVDGELQSVTRGGIGLAPVSDGTKVEVQLDGPAITIVLNDQPVGIFRDPDLQSATKVGMIVSAGGADTARWDNFTAQAASPTAVD